MAEYKSYDAAGGSNKGGFKIRSRIMLAFSIPILCIIMLGILTYTNSVKAFSRQYKDFVKQTVNKTSSYVNSFMLQVESISYTLASDESFIKFYAEKKGSLNDFEEIKSTLNYTVKSNPYIKDGYFISAVDDKHISSNAMVNFDKKSYSLFLQSDDYVQISAGSAKEWIADSDFLANYKSDRNSKNDSGINASLSLIREVKSASLETLGYIYLEIQPDKTASILNDINFGPNSYIVMSADNSKEIALIKDLESVNSDSIIVHTVAYDKIKSDTQKTGGYTITYKNNSYYMYYQYLTDNNIPIIALIPEDNIKEPANDVLTTTIIISLIACTLAAIIATLLSKSINYHIKMIIDDVINISKGNFAAGFKSSAHVDFSELGQSLNTFYQRELELHEKLLRDDMTGLYDKDAFYEMLGKEVTANINKQPKKLLSLAIIDIDDFKQVNDTYGHSSGDRILCLLADIMKKYSKRTDYPCRYGGEEFAIIFSNTQADDAKDVIDLMLSEFRTSSKAMLDKKISFSCGLYEYNEDIHSTNDIFEKADELLYTAKKNGKSKCVTCATKV